ncbi:MAG TPA: ATP-binding protein [Acidimicrobiales bacterium]|nr:ATP-binding protein [Acidimicrobiales bacterium]
MPRVGVVQLVLGIVALVAGAAAAWLLLLYLRTNRRSGEQIRILTESLRSAGAAQDCLAEVEDRALTLGAAVERLPLGVIVRGPDRNELFRNSAAAELVGDRPSDALASRAVAEVMALAAAGRAESRPLELHGPPRRTLSLTGVPLPGGAAAVVVEDVSERRRLDTVRRDFVANVSHELKTPVAALGLLAETLAAEDDLDVVRRLVGRMQDEAFRVNGIIDDLLDLSRLEGEPTLPHRPVRVDAVVAEAVESVRQAADFRGIRIAVGEIPESWELTGERRQLVSALANLLGNAVKYSEEGSAVEVRARAGEAMVMLEVEDHGIGIPSRELDRIFERFYRVDRGRGRGTGGTGLGLSIVRHVATNHGGEIRVSSIEGEGSVFTLILPVGPGATTMLAETG